MASEIALFSTTLISQKVQKALPKGVILRPLQRTDFKKHHLDVLRDLTAVDELTEAEWLSRFDWMKETNGAYFILVLVEGERIVGTGTLVVRKKFLYKTGTQGHIEDFAIIKEKQNMKLGIKLMDALGYVAEKVGCYKAVLDCEPKNEGFYEKCGYHKVGNKMHLYYDQEAKRRGI